MKEVMKGMKKAAAVIGLTAVVGGAGYKVFEGVKGVTGKPTESEISPDHRRLQAIIKEFENEVKLGPPSRGRLGKLRELQGRLEQLHISPDNALAPAIAERIRLAELDDGK